MSKKLKVVITIIAVCLGLFFVGTKAYATTGKSINETTRIRKKANTNSEVVGTLDKNEKVEILSEEDGWYKVNYRNLVTGYIRNDLLQVDEEKKQEENKTENVEETKTENKEEDKTESVEETKTENEEENKTENVEENETNNEVKEETNNENVLVENTELELKSDIEVQLLPVIFSCKTGKISANTKVTVSEVVGNWARIESDEVEGWIPTSKIQSNEVSENKDNAKKEEEKEEEKSENKKMYVNTVTLNLREKANSDSKVVTQLNQNDEVTVVKVVDNTWSKVEFKNYEGYTASKYLSEKKAKDITSRSAQEIRKAEEAKKKEEEEEKKKEEEEAKKKAEKEAKKKAEEEAKKKAEEAAKKKNEETKKTTEESKKTTSTKTKSSSKKSSKTTGADIVAYAKKFLGCRYVYGTAGPKTFDCSGLTSYVYKHFGYSLNRTSGGQRSDGKNVKKSDLEPGDILCFTGHVGIYIGGNKFIHAANPRKGVIISSLSESYYVKHYITASRIL